MKTLIANISARFILLSIGVRLSILGICFFIIGFSIDDLLAHSDAPSYINCARLLIGEVSSIQDWDARVFPGWSYFLAIFGFFDLRWVAIVLSILLASLAGGVHSKLFPQEEQQVWLFVFLSPTFIFQSNLGMSEPILILCQLLGLLFFLREKSLLSALFIGFSGVIRPTAIFLFLPMFLLLVKKGKTKDWFLFTLLSGLPVLIMLVINYVYFQDPLVQFHQYQGLPNIGSDAMRALGLAKGEGSHFGIPFVEIVRTSLLTNPPVWKQFFIWGHVLLIVLAFFSAFRKKKQDDLTRVMKWWMVGNTIFIFSTGEYWAFHSFDRYFTWALPAYSYFIGNLFKWRTAHFLALGAVSFLITLFAHLKFLI